MANIIDGKVVSSEVKEKIKRRIRDMVALPTLAVIRIGEDEASGIYIRGKEKACNEVGINFTKKEFPSDVTEEEIISYIVELNKNEEITGILLQLPIPAHLNARKIIDFIDPNKDVDGLTTTNIGCLNSGESKFIPCTPKGIMTLLEYYKIPISGKDAVVVGRSNLVGKPIASLLLKADASVTVCHGKTDDLKSYTKEADILVSAVGKKHLITADMVKPGAVVIDVGINRENNKIYGDVDYENVSEIASYITPVPGGVGPMTIASLLDNVAKENNDK